MVHEMGVSKNLILLSGGIDSFVCAHLLLARDKPVSGLFIDYGQAALPFEASGADAIGRVLKIAVSRATIDVSLDIHDGEITGRNMMLVSTALASPLISQGAIVLGIHAGTNYYDCGQRFYSLLDSIVQESSDGLIRLEAPLLHWEKSKVLKYAMDKRLPLDLTYSCERGTDPVCGKCLSCQDRRLLC